MVFQGCFGNHDEKMQEGWLKLRQEASRSIEGARNPHHCSRGGIDGVRGIRLDLLQDDRFCNEGISPVQLWKIFAEMATRLAWWDVKHEGLGPFESRMRLVEISDLSTGNKRHIRLHSIECRFFFRAQNQHLLLLHTAAYVDVESTSMAEDPGCVNLGYWQVNIQGLKSELDSFLLYHTLLRLTTDVPSTCPWCFIKVPLISWVRCSRSRRIPMSNMRLYLDKATKSWKKNPVSPMMCS